MAAIDAQTGQLTVDWDDGDTSFRDVPELEGVPAVRSCQPPAHSLSNFESTTPDDDGSFIASTSCAESRADPQNAQSCTATDGVDDSTARPEGNFSGQCRAALSSLSGVCKLYDSVCTANHTAASDVQAAAVYLVSNNTSLDMSQPEAIEDPTVRPGLNVSSAEQVAQIQVGRVADIHTGTP